MFGQSFAWNEKAIQGAYTALSETAATVLGSEPGPAALNCFRNIPGGKPETFVMVRLGNGILKLKRSLERT
jgi:hypothetical protein